MKMGKCLGFVALLTAVFAVAADSLPVRSLMLTGGVDAENARLRLVMEIDSEDGAPVNFLYGTLSVLGQPEVTGHKPSFWRGAPKGEVRLENGVFVFIPEAPGRFTVAVDFMARVTAAGSQRSVRLSLPETLSGRIDLEYAGDCTDFSIAQAMADGAAEEGVWRGVWHGGDCDLTWQVRLAENAELSLSYDILGLVKVGSGTVDKFLTVTGNVGMGEVTSMQWLLPGGDVPRSVTARNQADFASWSFDRASGMLTVEFSRPVKEDFTFYITTSQPLESIPGTVGIRPVLPVGYRANCNWLFGTEYGLKLDVESAENLLQSGPYEPLIQLASGANQEQFGRNLRQRMYFESYGDFDVRFGVSTVEPAYTAETVTQASIGDAALALRYDVKLDIRETALKEVVIAYDGRLNFNRLIADRINPQDYEIRETGAGRSIRLTFASPVEGAVEFSLYFERDIGLGGDFDFSGFTVEGARSSRGTLLVAADTGIDLEAVDAGDLTPVHPDTLPTRVAGLRHAYIHRQAPWKWAGRPVAAPRHLNGEIFELYSVGENRTFGLALFTMHLAGAPAERLYFSIPDYCENLEFTGIEIANLRKIAEQDGMSRWELVSRRKLAGDLVFLATFEIAADVEGRLGLGGITLDDAVPEAVYVAVSGTRSMTLAAESFDGVFEAIDSDELPREYRDMIGGQTLGAFRAAAGAAGVVKVSSYGRAELPRLLVSSAGYVQRFEAGGQSVVTATLRVRNQGAQHLRMTLPSGARLWQVRSGGKAERVASDGTAILIPLERRDNLNEEIVVELTYALDHAALETADAMSVPVPEIVAPVLKRTYRIELPERFVVTSTEPDTGIARNESYIPGFAGLDDSRLWRLALKYVPLGVLSLFFLIGGLTVAVGAARRKPFLWGLGAVGTAAVGVIMAMAVLSTLNYTWLGALNSPMPVQAVEFVDSADFGQAPTLLKVGIGVMEQGSWTAIVLWIAAALVLAAGLALWALSRRRWIGVAALTAAMLLGVAAAAQSMAGATLLVLLGIPVLGFLVPALISLGLFRRLRSRAALVFALFLGLTALLAAAPVARDYHYAVEWRDEGRAGVELRADVDFAAGESWAVGKDDWIISEYRLPEHTRLERGETGWLVTAGRKTSGEIAISFAVPSSSSGVAEWVDLVLPAGLDGRVTTILADADRVTLTGAVAKVEAAAGEGLRSWEFHMPVSGGVFSIRREAGGAMKIPAEIFAEYRAFLRFRLGAVAYLQNARVWISGGEVDQLQFVVPGSVEVTGVTCDGLETWRFDTDSRVLTLYFPEPQQGAKSVDIQGVGQIADLPGTFEYASPELAGAAQQSGLVYFLNMPELKLDLTGVENASPVDLENPEWKVYRYSGSGARLSFAVEELQPELRAEAGVAVHYQDEQVTLKADLTLEVVKGGVFSTLIALPAGYEVTRLTGEDVSFWQERDGGDSGSDVAVYFHDRLAGTSTRLTLELTRLAVTGGYGREEIPAFRVRDAAKLSGVLQVSGVRGQSLKVFRREGVTAIPGGGDADRHVLNFKLLNPDWKLAVDFDTAPAWVQVSTLQTLRLRQASAEIEITADFKIENNGIKSLSVELPENITLPEFDGRDIQAVENAGGGRWRIHFTRKIERSWQLRIRGRLLREEGASARLAAVKFPEAASVSGQLAVYVGDALELKETVESAGLTSLDPRVFKAEFGNAQSSMPIEAWHTIGSDWQVELAVSANPGVGTLKAVISRLEMVTQKTLSGIELNRTLVSVNNAGDNFLRFTLPPGAEYWGALVNGIAQATVADGGDLLVPLEANGVQVVEINYLVPGAVPALAGKAVLNAPAFELPLRDIVWRVIAPEGYVVEYAGGDLDERRLVARPGEPVVDFNTGLSLARSRAASQKEQQYAQQLMDDGRRSVAAGEIQKANEVMQNAIQFSQSDAERKDMMGEMLLYNRSVNLSNIATRQESLARSRRSGEDAVPAPGVPGSAQSGHPSGAMQAIADRIFTQQQEIYRAPALFNFDWEPAGAGVVLERALETGVRNPLRAEVSWHRGYAAPARLPGWAAALGVAALALALSWLIIPKRIYSQATLNQEEEK